MSMNVLLWYSLFHYSITAYTQFPVLLVVPLHHVTYQGHEQFVCSLKRPSLNCGEAGGEFHSCTFPVTPSIREVMSHAERWCVSSLGTCCEVHVTIFSVYKFKKFQWFISSGSKSTSTSLSAPEDIIHNFAGWGHYSGLLLCFTSLILSQNGGTNFLCQSWYSGRGPLAYSGSTCEPPVQSCMHINCVW